MLAPLPRLYRVAVVLGVLAIGVIAGIWVAQAISLPFGGLVVGSAAGLAVGFLLVHDFHRSSGQQRALRRS